MSCTLCPRGSANSICGRCHGVDLCMHVYILKNFDALESRCKGCACRLAGGLRLEGQGADAAERVSDGVRGGSGLVRPRAAGGCGRRLLRHPPQARPQAGLPRSGPQLSAHPIPSQPFTDAVVEPRHRSRHCRTAPITDPQKLAPGTPSRHQEVRATSLLQPRIDSNMIIDENSQMFLSLKVCTRCWHKSQVDQGVWRLHRAAMLSSYQLGSLS